MQLRFRAGAGAAIRLGRNENVLAKGRQHGSVNLFRAAIPIINRIIEIVDPKVISPQCDGFSFLKRNQGKTTACLPNHGKLLARLSKCPTGDISSPGFWRFCAAAVAARPANTPPINVLRFIGPTSFRLWMDPDSVSHAGVRRYTENGWPPCGEYRISTRSSDLAAAGGGTVPLIRISLGLTSRP